MTSEKIILTGKPDFLKPIISEIIAFRQLINNRSIGDFCGYSLDEYVRAKPQSFKLKLLFYSVKEPPWKPPGKDRLVTATYHVPFVSKAKIDWQTIKTACGGDNGYMWGRFRCTANIEDGNGSIRQMQIHGNSESEAEDRLTALLTALSSGKIITQSTTEEKKVGRRDTDKFMYKESTRIYPAYFTIINQEKIVTESNLATLGGNYRKSTARIPLWTDTKPVDTDDLIKEALRVKGSPIP